MGTRIMSVFAPKGGVGKTTIAFNLAVALGQLGQRTVLIDGSLQFGDLRSLLKVPSDAPSILDLPTDRIAESDLGDVLWRDPSGIDILLAPPRIEMAEMVTPRDLEKILSLLRRVYSVLVIDMSSHLNDVNLAFLDTSDTIVEIVTYDSTTIHNTVAMADTFRAIGYPASKVHYLVNRADSPGGIDPGDLERALGRIPEHRVVSDGILVVQSNNEGVPFVLANPGAPVSQDICARPRSCSGPRGSPPAPRAASAVHVRPAPPRCLRLGGRRPHGPARDRPTVAARVHDLPRRQRPRAVRRPVRRRGAGVLHAGPRRARGTRRQGHRRRLQHVHGRRA